LNLARKEQGEPRAKNQTRITPKHKATCRLSTWIGAAGVPGYRRLCP
jgi:hypothetical protein